jgi:hypothetical protein
VLVGAVVVGAKVPVIGDELGAGTAAQVLTPRLPISVESSGIPARVLAVVDDAGVDVDDKATLPEPEPHIPDKPAVAATPELVDNPEVADVPDATWAADVVAAIEAVAGGEVPFSVTPPPS